MKTSSSLEAARRRPGTRLPFPALLTLACLAAAPLAAEPAPAPKDHALFVGTNLKIADGDRYLDLVGASADTVTVLADGQPRTLRRKAVGAVRIEPGLKLSSLVAQIDRFETAAIKIAPTGDRWAADRMQILLDSLSAQTTDAMDANYRQVQEAAGALRVAEGDGRDGAQQRLANANAAYAKSVNTNDSLRTAVPSFLPQAAGSNGVEVSCELSAPRSPREAYALLVTEYRTGSREAPQYAVHVEPLRRLGPRPERLRLVQSGLPEGFLLGPVELHVYADGQELATNRSAQRVDLTADDALRYLVLAHVASHPKETLPAAPLKIAVPAGFKEQVPAEELERPLYVTVGVDGTVRGVSAAADKAVATTAATEAAVRKFRYHPALEAGRPVESVVPLTLADCVR